MLQGVGRASGRRMLERLARAGGRRLEGVGRRLRPDAISPLCLLWRRVWPLGPVAPQRQMVSVNVPPIKPVGAGRLENRQVVA